jgi:hypothetical protein
VNELQISEPILEVLAATIGLVAIIIVHGAGIRAINGWFSRAWVRVTPDTRYWRVNLLLALVIGSMTLLHLVETLIWAVPLYLLKILPGLRDSYYYVLESYTTLGEGTVALPERWRLIGPIIAMSGLFTFGWTGSVLVSIMTDFGKFDRSRASGDAKKRPGRRDRGP